MTLFLWGQESFPLVNSTSMRESNISIGTTQGGTKAWDMEAGVFIASVKFQAWYIDRKIHLHWRIGFKVEEIAFEDYVNNVVYFHCHKRAIKPWQTLIVFLCLKKNHDHGWNGSQVGCKVLRMRINLLFFPPPKKKQQQKQQQNKQTNKQNGALRQSPEVENPHQPTNCTRLYSANLKCIPKCF